MADARAITPTRKTARIRGIYEKYARTYDAANQAPGVTEIGVCIPDS
jgi:hypothetical protein